MLAHSPGPSISEERKEVKLPQEQVKSVSQPEISATKNNPHISVLEGNGEGKDFVTGDIHGSLDLFLEAVKRANLQNGKNRLFIVGDLGDKGAKSLEVILEIIRINKERECIFVTLGNHEEIFLQYYEALVNSEKDHLTQEAKADAEKKLAEAIQFSKQSGQEWALKLNPKEAKDRAILDEIANYFKKLPYIMHVKNTDKAMGFFMAHAGLPFENQDELRRDLNQLLDADKKNYCLWARNTNDPRYGGIAFGAKSINVYDDVVYCGHNILGMLRHCGYTINLDTGSFFFNGMLLVNHTDCTAEIINQKGINDANALKQIAELSVEIPIFLQYLKRLKAFSHAYTKIIRPSMKYKFKGLDPITIRKFEEVSHSLTHAINDDPNLKLFIQKFNILKNIIFKDLLTSLKKNSLPSVMAKKINKRILKELPILEKKFAKSPNSKFDKIIQELLNTFMTRVLNFGGDQCVKMLPSDSIWVRSQNHMVYQYPSLDDALKKFFDASKFHLDDGISCYYLKRSKQCCFIKNDKILKLEASNNIVNFKLIRKLLTVVRKDTWHQFSKLAPDCIRSVRELSEFYSLLFPRHEISDLFNYFLDEEFRARLTANLSDIGELILNLPLDKRFLAREILLVYKRHISELGAKNLLTIPQCYLSILKVCINQINEVELKAKLTSIASQLMHLNANDDLLVDIFMRLISVIFYQYPLDKKIKALELNLVGFYLSIRTLDEGFDYVIGNVLQEILQKEFDIDMPKKLNRVVSSLSNLHPETDYNKKFNALQDEIFEVTKELKIDGFPAKKTKEDFYKLVGFAIHEMNRLKNMCFEKLKPLLFNKLAVDRSIMQINKLRSVLANHHVFVPKGLDQDNFSFDKMIETSELIASSRKEAEQVSLPGLSS